MSRHRKPAGFLSRPRSVPSLGVDEWNVDVPVDPAVDVTDIEVDLPSVVGSQAAAPTVERIGPANVSPYISVGYAPVPQQTVAYPAPEPVAIAPAPEPVIETVVTFEPPVAFEPPIAFEPPAAYVPPAAYEPPATYEPPMVQESPVSYEPPVAYAPPVEDVAPVAAEPPVAYDAPVADVPEADPVGVGPLEPHVVRTNTSRTAYTPRIGPSRRVRRAAEKTSRRKRRLVIAAAVAAVAVAVTAITVAIGGGTHGQPTGVTAPAPARQSTAVVMLAGARGDMVAGALVAFEPTGATSNAVLLPSKVIASIPGHGALQLAQVTEFDRATLPASTVSDMFGVRVDASWIVDESALQALVDRVGGITVDSVDTDVRASVGGKSVVVPAGTSQHLNGGQAVAFASYLAQGEDETARLARFQQVLTSVVAALPANASDVPSFLSSFGAGSSLGGSATALATTLTGFRASYAANQSKVVTLPTTTIDSGGDAVLYGVDQEQLRVMVTNDLGGAAVHLRSGGLNRVLVENGIGTPGLGECVRNKLVAQGFDFKGSDNVPGFTYRDKPSVVLIYSDQQPSVDAGQAVATALHLPASAVQISQEPQDRADVIVVLGNDYKC